MLNREDDKQGPLLAISVQQPWAELILQERKHIEVRTWSDLYRGRIWLHTGRRCNESAAAYFSLRNLFVGGYVGLVTVVDIVAFDSDRWEQWRKYHLVPGPLPDGAFAWILSDPIRLARNIPAPGRLKLFRVDPELESSLLAAVPRTSGDRS